MVAYQPGDGFGFRRGEAEARAELLGHLRAQYAVIATAPLGDVMQQHGDVEHPAREQFAHEVGGQRMILR